MQGICRSAGQALEGARPPFVLGRRPFLDGLRGVACLCVLGGHYQPPLLKAAWAVDLFFVLSAFLITALLLQEHGRTGAISLGKFYRRRALRVLPASLCVLAACWLGAVAFGSAPYRGAMSKDGLCVLLYCYNWRLLAPDVLHPPPLMPLWSLAVEEQFYLVWPVLLTALLALRVRLRWVACVPLVGLAVAVVARSACWQGPASFGRVYYGTDTRSDAIWVGCLLGILVARVPGPKTIRAERLLRAAAWLSAAGFLGLLGFVGLEAEMGYLSTALQRCGAHCLGGLFIAVCIAALVWSPPPLLRRVLESRVLVWFGNISYGAYLWGAPVNWALIYLYGMGHLRQIAPVAAVLTVVAGVLTNRWVERPVMRWKDRLERRPRRTPAVQAPAARRVA
jgi:peptidoglycan/LPS O-acetylase OafA/YrhL